MKNSYKVKIMHTWILILAFLPVGINLLHAQNGVLIGPTAGTANASAMLEVSSTNKGFLLPRVNLVALSNGTSPVNSPAAGLLVYNLGAGGVPAVGVYYWDGVANAWVQLTAGGMSGSGTTNYVTKWTNTNALGNSQIFDDATNVGIGTTSMQNKLQVDGSASVYNDIQSTDSRYRGGFIERGWSTSPSSPAYLPSSAYVTVTDAPVGNVVTRISGAQTWVYGPKISMDRTQRYLVEGWVRYTSGSPGVWYFCVQNYDNAGTNISGDGSDWHYPVSGAAPPGTWTKYSFIVGPGGVKDHSPAARFMSVGWIANYGGGTGTYELSGWRITPIPSSVSTTFVHWGRADCPSTSSIVYSGYAAGGAHNHSGSGANTLCMTTSPDWTGASYSDGDNNGGLLYGTEFQGSGYGIATFGSLTSAQTQDYDATCAVCIVDGASNTLMVPGATVCPSGWARQYWGYLMSSHYTQYKSEFVCVVYNPTQNGSVTNHDGNLWYPVEKENGSLGNPGIYPANREITCVVCTK